MQRLTGQPRARYAHALTSRFRSAACAVVFGFLVTVGSPVHAKELRVTPQGTVAVTVQVAVYSTISAAMSALEPGDHLVISPGVYRETLRFPNRNWTSSTRTVVEGQGAVEIRGGDIVNGWVAAANGSFYVSWPNEPAQVVLDQVPLQQIGGTVFDGFPTAIKNEWTGLLADTGGIWPGRMAGNASHMAPGTFIFDAAAHRLYVRPPSGELAGHVVEVSSRTYSAYGVGLADVTLKNLSFRYGNTSVESRAALVTLSGQRIVLDHVSVSRADSVGVELDGDDNVMRDVSADHCGQLGIKARGQRALIEHSTASFNNTRGFNKWWEAGGAKFVGDGGLRDSVVAHFTAIGNQGDGIWFDWDNRANRLQDSAAEYNTGFGIQYEASSGATIVNNVVIGNGQRGIYLPHSSASLVAWNLVASNRLQGIVIIDEGRVDPTNSVDLRAHGDHVFANVLAWNGAALVLPLKLADNTSNDNVFVDNSTDVQWMLGWNAFGETSLPDWNRYTRQDSRSTRIRAAIDRSFLASVTKQEPIPDLAWYRTLRARLAPVSSESVVAMRASASEPSDGLPGPIQ